MKEISVSELNLNPYLKIAKDWMLLTAGTEGSYNTMTCSWGHLGSLWNMPTTVCYVRPQRYTKEFMDREELYTLSFFPEGYKKALGYLGSHSGRDGDKVAAVGLNPVFGEGYTYFAEAELTILCRKLYRAPLVAEGFLDKSILAEDYPNMDLHDVYIGEIVKILVKE